MVDELLVILGVRPDQFGLKLCKFVLDSGESAACALQNVDWEHLETLTGARKLIEVNFLGSDGVDIFRALTHGIIKEMGV